MDQTPEVIRASVKERYGKLARSPESEKDFPVGPASAKTLAYRQYQLSVPMLLPSLRRYVEIKP